LPDLPDGLLLARLQFAFTISFHIIFPAFTIGLASYLAFLEGAWLITGRDVYMRLFRYWIRMFAVTFGMGVVSGLVMSYQFGTNWSVFSDRTGPILGPLMGYEVLSAFFLEAGFLGIMLFGMKRVGKGLHYFATLMVAAGTLFSAFWILSANSWMHTPAGYAINQAGARRLSYDRLRGRRGRRVASAEGSDQRRGARDVLDGALDGYPGRADPDRRRRPARPEHPGASAGEDRGDGGSLRDPAWRAPDPVRHARHGD
jgi:hypothetical protein